MPSPISTAKPAAAMSSRCARTGSDQCKDGNGATASTIAPSATATSSQTRYPSPDPPCATAGLGEVGIVPVAAAGFVDCAAAACAGTALGVAFRSGGGLPSRRAAASRCRSTHASYDAPLSPNQVCSPAGDANRWPPQRTPGPECPVPDAVAEMTTVIRTAIPKARTPRRKSAPPIFQPPCT